MITLLPRNCRIYVLIVTLMQEEHLASNSTNLFIKKAAKCLQNTVVDIPGSAKGLSYRKQEEFSEFMQDKRSVRHTML